jgi:hypothetical protein
MKRLIGYFSLALLTFVIGVLTAKVGLLNETRNHGAPLLLSISSDTRIRNVNYYLVTVRNVSDKSVRGYSLGYDCSCRSWDNDDNPYPAGVSFTNPAPERQLLRPGESQQFPLPTDLINEPRVWLDLVHFDNGADWGPNRSHKEGYVRQ